ncbi:helix-turn-helix domain-containing protein [Sphingomonas sp. GV3]|uniref:AraC family transcriptional regulator n=1 Tax=Sphingomonas sp. GV3 TaxID=3040671 RepID=UPI00280ABE5B|nr:helix-turn-helix domain-containing protein [Sphingomonas sp. GV3]
MDLVFGWRSATLLTAAAVLVPLAFALLVTLRNRLANRTLALLILVLIGVFTPWLIGFAGFYDRWRWLTFLPVAVPLLVPAVLRFYVTALTTGALPPRWRWMLLPGLVEFAFQAVSFCLPLAAKDRWATAALPIAGPLFAFALVASFGWHVTASLRLLRRYRLSLNNAISDEGRFAARWLATALVTFAFLWSVWGVVLLWDWLWPLGYTGLMWLYLLIAAVALFLAIEGWRHATDPFPTLAMLEAAGQPTKAARDWSTQGRLWADQVAEAGWVRDPDLDITGLARRLGTNSGYLSRALNEGLGVNFSTFVNDLRCRFVVEAMEAGSSQDVLALALDAGFASKASFNRAFRAATGMTPSAYRARVSKAEKVRPSSATRRHTDRPPPTSGA